MTFDDLYKTLDHKDFATNVEPPRCKKDEKTFLEVMKMLEGRDIKSTLKKEFPDVIAQILGPFPPSDGENGYYRLQMIVVPYKQREQGLATKFMKRFIELARGEYRDIFLTPSAEYQEDDGMTKGMLIQWHKKLGFEKKHKDDFRSTDTYCFYS